MKEKQLRKNNKNTNFNNEDNQDWQNAANNKQGNDFFYQYSDRDPYIVIMEQENINDIKTGKKLNELNIENIINIAQAGKNRVRVELTDVASANKILKHVTLKTIDKYNCFIHSLVIQQLLQRV